MPSRLYGILAAGRPVLASADADSETATLVREVGCGLVVPPGRPDLIETTIRSLVAGDHDLHEMGQRGRAWVEENADREVALRRYRDELAAVLNNSRDRS